MKFEECLERKLIRPHDFNRETIRKEIENAEKNYEFEIMEIAIVSS